MNKKIIIIFILIVIFILGFVGYKFFTDKKHMEEVKLEVATDPHFPEVKGELMAGFPEIAVYPNATIIASAKTNKENEADSGYRAKWTINSDVPTVMKWYQTELPKNGWIIAPPDDPENTGEQVTKIAKGNLQGTLGIEAEMEGSVEIVIEVYKI